MNDQTPKNDSQIQPLDRREARRLRRAARWTAAGSPGRGSAWVVGIILIVLGAAFLMQNTGVLSIPLNNWWALLLLIPIVGAFSRAWRMYVAAGNRLDVLARGAVIVGLVLTLVMLALLLNLDWAMVGPAILILIGIGILVSFLLPRAE